MELMQPGATIPDNSDPSTTHWFAVYRPTSRDAIARMLDGKAVGKGLDVKGKSSKRNMLSGFVPFVQIHHDSDKELIETSPANSRFTVYYKSEMNRATAMEEMQRVMDSMG